MSSYNRVLLMGNLTRDPEIRYTPKGSAVSDLGLAINRKYKQGEQWKEEVTFVDVTVWAKQAELAAQYLAKGRTVFVEGRLEMDSWQDKNTGEKRNKLKVVAETLQFIGGKGDGQRQGRPPSRQQQFNDDDVAF